VGHVEMQAVPLSLKPLLQMRHSATYPHSQLEAVHALQVGLLLPSTRKPWAALQVVGRLLIDSYMSEMSMDSVMLLLVLLL
jgi:gamma-glutamylcysteine synthetase